MSEIDAYGDGIEVDGGKLRRHRRAAGLTQDQLGAASETTQTYISKLEKGVIKSTAPARLQKLADILRVEPRELTADTGVTEAPGGVTVHPEPAGATASTGGPAVDVGSSPTWHNIDVGGGVTPPEGDLAQRLDRLEAKLDQIAARGAVVQPAATLHGEARVDLPGRVEPLATVPVRVLRDAASLGSSRTHAEGDEVPYPIRPRDIGHTLVGVEVRGDCLEPSRIFSGQIAIVDMSIQPTHGDIVLARFDDELLVKRIAFDASFAGIQYLEADQNWDPLPVADGVVVIGVCVGFVTRPPRTPAPGRSLTERQARRP